MLIGYHRRGKAAIVLSLEGDIVNVIVLKVIKLFDVFLSTMYYQSLIYYFDFLRFKLDNLVNQCKNFYSASFLH